MTDLVVMNRALQLAAQGRGLVEPNPLVGAVIVRDGQIVGEGWHRRFGGPHAEVEALAQAGEAARGATLYATLEPCCHHGKTPPCTDAIIRAGIIRVAAAMEDPFPQVAGQGARQLREAGIAVEFGPGGDAAKRLNAPYLCLLKNGRPFVHAKWAMTLDGKIATRTGDSKWITNDAARKKVHELRGRMDGIVVGIGTALADDPRLTARPPGPRVATRVVLDRRCRLPVEGGLARTAREMPVLVAASAEAPVEARERLTSHGCEVLVISGIAELLQEFGRRRWTNVMVEGGAGVLGAFLDAGVVDCAHVFIAPKVVGGGLPAIGGSGVAKIADARRLADCQVEMLDGDVYMHGLFV